ncbi:MAG TPA: pyridoxamine 5'-phosphate oxidase [Bacteroidetes bacterium]|nr:pyridoxamine 5'-phosphate oxidase [Bacteroidota bacterium]HRK04045.1 pyridoxamine 5'-phosphate oxidase [Chlorobiota bacterium]
MNRRDIADLRTEYQRETLDEFSVAHNPLEQFSRWMDEVLAAEVLEPTAMTLATVGANGRPSARTVLLKGIDEGFVFYTNYTSRKGTDLESNPYASLLFFWPDLQRQVRVEGRAEKITIEESEAYFRTRPLGSKIGAWASQQSQPLSSRDELERRTIELERQYSDGNVPLPPFWGGYRLLPDAMEFWQGRPSRLHDRILYERGETGWTISRLSP